MGTGQCHFCATTMDTKNLKACSNCKGAFYCSKNCQTLHWKAAHKAVCASHAAQLGKRLGGDEEEEEVEQEKVFRRWLEVWAPAIITCLSIALDLANHQWDRHESHVLVLHIAHTGLGEDAQLFRVKKASLEPYANMVRFTPQIERDEGPPPPEFADRPHIRCIFYIEDKNDPTKAGFARVHAWCVTDLQLVCSQLEKDYSRVIAKQVIPLLASDINGMKKPGDVRSKFHLMIELPEMVQPLLDVAGVGVSGDGGGGLFRLLIEQLLRRYPPLS